MDLGIEGKVALVSGSYRGTGAGIARVLADEGVATVVHELEEGQAEAVAAEIAEAGGAVGVATGDVRTEEGARATAESALAAFGRIDILVNNYGAAKGRGWFDGGDDEWTEMFQTNIMSGARLVRELVPPMRERGWGRVIFLGTVGGERPRSVMPGYYASKASLANMTVGLAKELAGSGITVNTISPGMLATAEVRASLERRARKEGWGEDWDEIQRRASRDFMPNPTGRLGTVDEVGRLVAFLASEHAGYINGSNLRIDGGTADCV